MISVNTPDPKATPSLEALRAAVAAFKSASAPLTFDSSDPDPWDALLKWLNSWNCRIRYPRDGEKDLFAIGMAQWWDKYSALLPDRESSLAHLTDAEIIGAGDCFAGLVTVAVGDPAKPRTLQSTAASKALYAFRSCAFMPWDAAIANKLHRGRDGSAYVAHQRLGRAWARDLLGSTGLSEERLAESLGTPGRPLAKILDDYCYLRFTRGETL